MSNNEHWGIYDELRPKEIEKILELAPIAYLPWGAIEYHGLHNPVGLDSHKALGLCKDFASNSGGLVFPPINISANLIKSYPGVDFPKHSIEFSEKAVQIICEEYFEQLAHQGFKIIVLLSGHAGEPHLQILKKIGTTFNERYPDRCFWVIAEFDLVPDGVLEPNHSAFGETAIQLYYKPKTVDLSTLPKERKISLELDAISGADPRQADFEAGKRIVDFIIDNGSKKILELIAKYIK